MCRIVSRSHCSGLSLFIFSIVSLILLLVSIPSQAQGVGVSLGPGITGTPIATRDGATLRLKIVDENKQPLKKQALARLTSVQNGAVMFESTHLSEAEFKNVALGKYLLEAGAAGYLAVREQFTISDVGLDRVETIMLHRDPSAVDLTLKDAGKLPSKARKEAEKGVQALELGNFQEARIHLENAQKSYGSSAEIDFLLGYVFFQQQQFDRALDYLKRSVEQDPNNVQAHSALGQLYYDRKEYQLAAQSEELVVKLSPESEHPRLLLANAYLGLKQYDKSVEQAQRIVDSGSTESRAARLVLGQALAGQGNYDRAREMLQSYLDSGPSTASSADVRKLISDLQTAKQNNVASPNLLADQSLASDRDATPVAMFIDVDAHKPSVAPSVQCPANVLEMVADRSKELVNNVAQFSAIEDMIHESLTPQGIPRNRESRRYNYIASITEHPQGALIVTEYRDAAGSVLDMPDQITTTGLAVLAIVFHPKFSDDFDMSCEGLGDWRGTPAWLVHFRQRADKPARLQTYVVNGANYPIHLKGRAWFAADSYQILHLETDLAAPVPEIHLVAEHTAVDYGPVEFKRSNIDLWLPKSADLYVHFGKRHFRRQESFDHFMLFSTDAVDKPHIPAKAEQIKPAADTPSGGAAH